MDSRLLFLFSFFFIICLFVSICFYLNEEIFVFHGRLEAGWGRARGDPLEAGAAPGRGQGQELPEASAGGPWI